MTTPAQDTETWVPTLTFAARLKLVRHQMGWNIKEAALACGIPPQSWRGWELQGRLPHNIVATVRQIQKRTGVDATWLREGGPMRAGEPNVGMETSTQPTRPIRRPADRPRDNRPPHRRANVHHSLVRPHALPRPANKRSTDRHHPYTRRNLLATGDTVSHE